MNNPPRARVLYCVRLYAFAEAFYLCSHNHSDGTANPINTAPEDCENDFYLSRNFSKAFLWNSQNERVTSSICSIIQAINAGAKIKTSQFFNWPHIEKYELVPLNPIFEPQENC